MEAVDGNAIAGPLLEYFGAEMTAAVGSCGHCGTTAQVAELRVYACAPGSVARCRACGSVVIVIVETPDALRVTFAQFTLQRTP